MQGLENIYKKHHKDRGKGFVILQKERGEFLRKHIGIGKKVLDIGCRDGQLTSTYIEGNEVTGVDIDGEALIRVKDKLGIEIVHKDLNNDWGFEKESYDVVVACEFLEHIYFPDLVSIKVKEVLKNGGVFVGTIPHAYSIQSKIKFLLGIKKGTPLEDPTHINHFTFKEFKSILLKEFEEIEFLTYVPPRYGLFSRIFPITFAHYILFCFFNYQK